MVKFSIITCTYNSRSFIEKNIESVKNQSCRDFEHIFIDGFSTDGTLEIINKYQTEFSDQVKIFQFKPEGISRAMNQGIEKSAGEYIIHLHSDDSLFDNGVLQDTTEFLEKNNYPDWIYGKINVVVANQSKGFFPVKNIWQKNGGEFIKNYFLKFYNYIPHQAVFIKKDVFDNLGFFNETLKCAMDLDLWLRIRDKTHWIFFNRIISNFSIHPEAQSSGLKNKEGNVLENLSVRREYLNKFELIIFKIIDFLLREIKSNYQM